MESTPLPSHKAALHSTTNDESETANAWRWALAPTSNKRLAAPGARRRGVQVERITLLLLFLLLNHENKAIIYICYQNKLTRKKIFK